MPNLLLDPSFETGVGWTLGSDCDVNGASFQATQPRTGVRSLRIQSRFQAIGPTTTCGKAQQSVAVTPGKPYLFGVWFKSSGVFPNTVARVSVSDGFFFSQVTWNNNVSVYALKVGVFTPGATPLLYEIGQDPGTNNVLQSRFFDDAFVEELTDLDHVDMLQQAIRAGVVDPASLLSMLDPDGRVRGVPASLGLSGVSESLAPFGRASRKS